MNFDTAFIDRHQSNPAALRERLLVLTRMAVSAGTLGERRTASTSLDTYTSELARRGIWLDPIQTGEVVRAGDEPVGAACPVELRLQWLRLDRAMPPRQDHVSKPVESIVLANVRAEANALRTRLTNANRAIGLLAAVCAAELLGLAIMAMILNAR